MVAAGTLPARRLVEVDKSALLNMVAAVVGIERLAEQTRAAECKAVDKLGQVVHRVLVRKRHNSHLEEHYRALEEEHMVSWSVNV